MRRKSLEPIENAMEGFDAAQGVVMNDSARQLVNDVLVWIGFGTVIVMPCGVW